MPQQLSHFALDLPGRVLQPEFPNMRGRSNAERRAREMVGGPATCHPQMTGPPPEVMVDGSPWALPGADGADGGRITGHSPIASTGFMSSVFGLFSEVLWVGEVPLVGP